ncbi:MAG: type II secretion system protein [Candidatus Omnitrophica bacterium]|nr:type II secretion system protein [Candidatus Omnitrophota bacterium]
MSKKGFTLLEVLVVLMILGFLTAMVAGHLSRIKGEAAIVIALNEMKDIKEAIRDRFYPDLGLIPEDLGPDGFADHLGPNGIPDDGDEIFDAKPEFSVKFLCLKDDGIAGDEYNEMLVFLTEYGKASLIDWDKYSYKGWRGPYMEQEVSHDYDGLVGAGTDYWPIIVNPWADLWEDKAQEEEKKQEVGWRARADAFREKKCYRIFGGQDKNLVQIVCYGADGEADCDKVVGTDGNTYVCIEMHTSAAANHPVSGIDWADFWALDNTQTGNVWAAGMDYESFAGDDLVMFIFGTGPIRRP